MTDTFRAGNLRNHLNAWSPIETPLPVLEWINSGVRLHFSKTPEGFILPNHLLSEKQEAFVDSEIRDLLTTGAIEECLNQPYCVSSIGSLPRVPKKEQKVSSYRGSKTPEFSQRDPQVSVRKYFHGLRPSAPSRLTYLPRYRERLSPHSCAPGLQKFPRHSLERSLVFNGPFSRSDSTEVRIFSAKHCGQ